MGARNKTNISNTAGGRLAEYRIRLNKTQEEFAEEIGISSKSLQDYENNRSQIPDSLKQTISEKYEDFDIHRLVTGHRLLTDDMAPIDKFFEMIGSLKDEEFYRLREIVDQETYIRLKKK